MTITDYINELISNSESEWIHSESPPYFLNSIALEASSDGLISFAEVKSHHGKATLRSNLDISFYWGLPWTDDFPESWATKNFADKKASGSAMDFFYRGALIFRQYYVHLDGARYEMPLPNQDISGGKVLEYWIPRPKYDFFKTYNAMLSSSDFDFALQQTGIVVRDTPWTV